MINKTDFLKNFAGQFEQTTYTDLSFDQCIRELEEWSSLIGLGVLAMIRDCYNVTLYIKELETVNTIEDLYQTVNKKANK